MNGLSTTLGLLAVSALLTPALAQVAEVQTQDFDMTATKPYGEIETVYEPYEVADQGAIVLSATTPGAQHPKFDVVGPDDFWLHFDLDDDPGEERVLGNLLPGIYSVAATDEALEVAHAVVEVRADEAARVHVELQPWAYTVGDYDPSAYYGTRTPDIYPGYPHGGYTVAPYETYGLADYGAIRVQAGPSNVDYVVTGPNGYSEEFQGNFTAENLPPGVYVIAATEEGLDLAVTSIEVRPGETLPVTLLT